MDVLPEFGEQRTNLRLILRDQTTETKIIWTLESIFIGILITNRVICFLQKPSKSFLFKINDPACSG